MKLELTQENIEFIAQELRRAYRRKRAALSGKSNRRLGRRELSLDAWNKPAIRCIDCNADPEEFIEAGFAGCKLSTGPYPPMFGSASAAGWWRESRSVVDVDDTTNTNRAEELLVMMSMRRTYYKKMATARGMDMRHVMLTDYTVEPVVGILLADGDAQLESRFIAGATTVFATSPVVRQAVEEIKPGLVERLLKL